MLSNANWGRVYSKQANSKQELQSLKFLFLELLSKNKIMEMFYLIASWSNYTEWICIYFFVQSPIYFRKYLKRVIYETLFNIKANWLSFTLFVIFEVLLYPALPYFRTR